MAQRRSSSLPYTSVMLHPNIIPTLVWCAQSRSSFSNLCSLHTQEMDIGAFPDPFLESVAMDEFLHELASGKSIRVIVIHMCVFFAHCAAVAEFEYSVNLQTGHDPMSESSNDSFTADCHFLLSTVFDLDSVASNLGHGHASQPGGWMHTPAHYNTAVSCGPSSQLSEPPTRYFSKVAHIQISSHLSYDF